MNLDQQIAQHYEELKRLAHRLLPGVTRLCRPPHWCMSCFSSCAAIAPPTAKPI